MIGVTTWIKQHVLKGVPFNRVGCKGQGNRENGLKVGRIIDAMFKTWCKTGKMPKGKPWANRRMSYIAAALKQRGIVMTDANVFVTRQGLKTHLDGVGRQNGVPCVVELKCTQASLENHRKAYDVACSSKPCITINKESVPNTERTHHQLQLAFGVVATKTTKGVVVLSASDGTAVYPLLGGISHTTFNFVAPKIVKPPARRSKPAGKPKRTKLSKWPGAMVAANGWTDVKMLKSGVAVLIKNSTLAVAVAAPSAKQKPPKQVLQQAASEVGATVQLFAAPVGKAWRCYRITQRYIGPAQE